MRGRWAFILVLIFPAMVFAQSEPEPNTGSDSFGFGARRFFSQLVFLNLFNGREHQNLLDISNGQCDTFVDKFINELYESADTPDDAEWSIGGITVANLNNTDHDKIQGGMDMPRIDGSIYETDGVIANQGPQGRNELDLVTLKLHKPANYQSNDRLTLAVSGVTGAGVRFYEDDFKEHDASFLWYSYHHLGVDYYVFDPYFISQQMVGQSFIFFADVNVQTSMNGVSIALFYDGDWNPFMGTYRVHQYDRCMLTGIWATGNVRTTQSRASFVQFGENRSQIDVSGANHEFIVGAWILLYESEVSYNRPYLLRIVSIDLENYPESIRLELDNPIPPLDDIPDGAPVLIGPALFSYDFDYAFRWGDVPLAPWEWKAERWIGLLGASDNRETGNGIELSFLVRPIQATQIFVPDGAAQRKLLRFDVTRQVEYTYSEDANSLTKLFPAGDETPNDDGHSDDEDNIPADGWLFSFDTPQLGNALDMHTRQVFGTEDLPPSFDSEKDGMVLTYDIEAREFVRVFIDDDEWTRSLEFQSLIPSGSRCSEKVKWRSRYHAEIEEVEVDFYWPVRFGANFIEKIAD